ncbi:heparinase II/III family protein [Litorimonas sp. RW-G-Af-16]|uniref:heparinase II/III family protein n=1 Tax=Litorimonas sp. RW-G-Af-16 TaxID=3241168 RepID=UPI00390CD05E
MSRPTSTFAPYMAALRHGTGKLWRNLSGPFSRLKLGHSRPKPFHVAPLKLTLGRSKTRDAIIRGQFSYAGQDLDVGVQGDPWTIAVPSTNFARWLHSFVWLEDMLGHKSEKGHARVRGLIDGWVMTYGEWNDFAWTPDMLGERLFYWLAFWSPALGQDAESGVAEKRRASALRQLKALRQSYARTSAGLPRLRAAAAITLGGARLVSNSQGYLPRGLDWLDDEIERQILPDGGHVSRSPAQTAEALKILLMLDQILQERGVEGSRAMSRAIDRLAPIVSLFQHSDGGLAVFQGGNAVDATTVKALLAAAPGTPKPFGYCPHTGYQRIALGETTLIIDTGKAPPQPFDTQTHLAPLAFELSTKSGRLIVSCGWNETQPAVWRRPVRAAAAHSTLILDDRSPGRLLPLGWKTKYLGEAVQLEPGPVKASRKEQDSGVWLEAFHEGYRRDYGLCHRRRLFIAKLGDDIRGEDSLYLPLGSEPLRRDQIPFDIRFHIHPDVRVSLSQDQASALLVQDGKTGWRFRTDGGPLRIEDSVYLAEGHKPVKTKQLVISGQAYGDSDGESRTNRVRWSFRELKARES